MASGAAIFEELSATEAAAAPVSAPTPRGFDVCAACESLTELHRLCRETPGGTAMGNDPDEAHGLATKVNALKTELVTAARQSHALQSELQELERLIALNIRHRMEVDEKKARRVVHNAKGGATPSLRPTSEDRSRCAGPRR